MFSEYIVFHIYVYLKNIPTHYTYNSHHNNLNSFVDYALTKAILRIHTSNIEIITRCSRVISLVWQYQLISSITYWIDYDMMS